MYKRSARKAGPTSNIARAPYIYGPISEPIIDLRHGDCLELLKSIPDHSVDLLFADPPYGMTFNHWDTILDFEKLWPQIERVLKPAGMCLIFSSQPFSSRLITSNFGYYRHSWYWKKTGVTGHLLAGRQPLRCLEEICVFGRNAMSATYNAQMTQREQPVKCGTKRVAGNVYKPGPWQREENEVTTYKESHPTHMLNYPAVRNQLVSTQKPVDLLRYLIRTYTNLGDLVLDPTMGSGSTGVACLREKRRFIGHEYDPKHFDIAEKRVAEEASWLLFGRDAS